ncbi:hypothetical protein [Desulfogranum marinum]|uniref:hypothetical protein n=1 Tax=Desulfogranum marinum TaxID=453220 RepID=UPI0029C93140|nr:hypothetical protein [Desulfogranum marinum]
MTDLLTILQRRFPEESEKIRQRLDEDPTLKEIEENYCDCVTALQHWRRSKAPEARARIVEYSTFSKEIEQEAINTYEAHVSQSRT